MVLKSIYHISDIHIRTGNYEESRYDEYLSVFNNLIDDFKKQTDIKDSIIVVTGDIVHNKSKIESSGIYLFNFLFSELTKLTKVYIIRGNHDYQQHNQNEVDLLSALINNCNYENLHYLNKTGTYEIDNIEFGVMAINDVLKAGDTSGQVDELPEFPKPKTDKIKIALYHGIVIDENNTFFKSKDIGIDVSWFKDYDLALLGDNHTQQINNMKKENYLKKENRVNESNPIWGYSGSLLQQNFGEDIKKHGYLKWDLENMKVTKKDINNSYCHYTYKDNEKIKLINFLDDSTHINNIKIRFIKNNSNMTDNISEIQTLLNDRNIKYKTYHYNNSLFQKETKKDEEEIKIINYNSPENWYEFIEENIDKNAVGDFDWKGILKNPEKLLINLDMIPETLREKTEEKNQKLMKYVGKYLESQDIQHNDNNKLLKLNYLEWDWVLCYGEKNYFNFDTMDNNVSLLNAQNGSGKSAFLEIICLSLFGEGIPSRTNKQFSSSIICQQKEKGKTSIVKLLFSLDDERFMITRTFLQQNSDKNKLLTKYVELFNINQNNFVSLKSGNKAVNEWISVNVGNINSFLLSSMLTQNNDQDFFSLKNSEQINLLDKSLSLESVNTFTELLKQTKLVYNNVKDNLESIFLDIKDNSKEVTEDGVENYKKQYIETKENLENIQKKLLDDNRQFANIKDEDIELTNEDIKKKINSIIIDDNEIDINNLYKETGKISNELGNIFKIFKDFKIIINNDDIRVYSSNSIFCFTDRDDCGTKYNGKEILKPVKEIEEEYEKCKEYFNNIDGDEIDYKEKRIELNEIHENKKKELVQVNSNFEKYNTLKNEYTTRSNTLLKKQRDLKNIDTTISECKQNLEKYEIMKNKIDKKKTLLQNNESLLIKLEENYNTYNKIKNNIADLEVSIKDIEDKDYPFNSECECCQKQPWKLLLGDLNNQLNTKKDRLVEIDKLFEENKTSGDKFLDLKIKLSDNIKKFRIYIEKYEEYNTKEKYWEEQIKLIEKYNKLNREIKELEADGIVNNRLLKKSIKLINDLICENGILESKLNDLDNMIILSNEYDNWIERKTNNDDDINWYNWYTNMKYEEYKDLNNKKKELDQDIDKYNKNLKNKEERDYWNKNLNLKEAWNKMAELKEEYKRVSNYLNIISTKYVGLKKDYQETKKNKDRMSKIIEVLNNINMYLLISEDLSKIFLNFRTWLYKNKILPIIISNTNDIIGNISRNNLQIDVLWSDKKNGDTFNWLINDGKNKPSIEKASGFQRFIMGLAIKITLSNLGVSKLRCGQLFIDEGFTSCDKEHLEKVPLFINSLLNLYNSVLLVSHLQNIKENISIEMNIERDEKKSLSKLNYGNKITITKKEIIT
jgi:DNA repair exonuclease SbcCD ATPase subunit/predicted phosphodiesterase